MLMILIFTLNASASDIQKEIEEEIGTEKLNDIIPESLRENEELQELSFTYDGASSTIGVNTVLGKIAELFFKGISGEIAFFSTIFSFLILSSLYRAFSEGIKNSALSEGINFAISLFLCVILYTGVFQSLEATILYVKQLIGFIGSLLPFLTTLMCMQGSTAEAVSGSAILVTVMALIESVCVSAVIPFIKILFSFVCAGFLSKVNFSPLIEFATSFATKTCTITMSIISAILYFRHAIASSADSLALRSVKLFAGNFIPIVGGMMSEASSTVIAAARLVKSTLGVFAFSVLLYMTVSPVISFMIRKISLKFLIAISKLLGCDNASGIMTSIYGIYNIMSALMISCGTFFIIAIAIFVKNGAA
jgi:stage III sporulation protein AE